MRSAVRVLAEPYRSERHDTETARTVPGGEHIPRRLRRGRFRRKSGKPHKTYAFHRARTEGGVMKRLGIDVGSTTFKAVLTDENGNILFTDY